MASALVCCGVLLGVVGSDAAFAAPTVDVANAKAIYKANACASCHQADRKLVGPAYRDIATKYRNDAGAQAHLEKVVRGGGSGVWGAIPMPSHPAMSDGDIRTVVSWILAGAPDK
nr:c-type cytochrome [Pararobbsia silviterrae]